jgi:hypothetical protein
VTKVIQNSPSCVEGRPYEVDGHAVVAGARVGSGGSDLVRPAMGGMTEADRRAAAEAWTRAALAEHASVAAFARLSLELLACGAPADLVLAAQQAGADEVRHARLAFSLASAYAGEAVRPGTFPFEASLRVSGDLAALAVSTVSEGCVGETLSVLLADEALRVATDPAVRQALRVIARDEARHAELAWRIVQWAIAEGGDAVRIAVAEVFTRAGGVQAPRGADGDASVLARHGRLDDVAMQRVVARGLLDVVLPCARALRHPEQTTLAA